MFVKCQSKMVCLERGAPELWLWHADTKIWCLLLMVWEKICCFCFSHSSCAVDSPHPVIYCWTVIYRLNKSIYTHTYRTFVGLNWHKSFLLKLICWRWFFHQSLNVGYFPNFQSRLNSSNDILVGAGWPAWHILHIIRRNNDTLKCSQTLTGQPAASPPL